MRSRNAAFLAAFATAALALVPARPAAAQSGDEIQEMRRDIQQLREGQKAIQQRLDDLAALLAKREQPEGMVLSIEGAPFLGDKDAKVTVIEFFDFQCGFCARHAAKTFPLLLNEYIKTGKLKYVVRDFPLDTHPLAPKAAEAAHCAGEQGKYWEMFDRLFENQKLLSPDSLTAHAEAIHLDAARFRQCLDSGRYESLVKNNQQAGELAGVDGTPAFFFGLTEKGSPTIRATKSIRGAEPYPYFKDAIEVLLGSGK